MCGFTCSDEITLVFPAFDPPKGETETLDEATKENSKGRPPNGGRIVKSVTLLAGFASTSFYKNMMAVLNKEPEKNATLITFVEKVDLTCCLQSHFLVHATL